MPDAVAIFGLGASTPIGRDAFSTAAAVRAGVNQFGEHPYMIDTAGEPMMVSRATWLDVETGCLNRLAALLLPAIDEALQALRANARPGLRVAIAVGMPSPRPGLPGGLADDLLARVSQRYGAAVVAVAGLQAGHASGLLLARSAAERLRSGHLDACVIAGVDSFIEPETLEWLEASGQLHRAGRRNNAWGFVPGEAAGAVLLMREALAAQVGLSSMGSLLGVGASVEAHRIKTETICTGAGLTTAFRDALAMLPSDVRVSDVYCDLNGEPYRADEYGFAALRTRERFVAASRFCSPADCWGDVGVAGGPLNLALAAVAASKGYASGDVAMVWASAESGERAAAVLRTG